MKILLSVWTLIWLSSCASSKMPAKSNSKFQKRYNQNISNTISASKEALKAREMDKIDFNEMDKAIIARNMPRPGQGDEQIGLFFEEIDTNRTNVKFTYEKGLWGKLLTKNFSPELANEIENRLTINLKENRINVSDTLNNSSTSDFLDVYENCMNANVQFSGAIFKPYEINGKRYADGPFEFTPHRASKAINSDANSLFKKASINQGIGAALMISWFATLIYFQETSSKKYYDETGNQVNFKMATTKNPYIAGLFIAWPVASIVELVIGTKQKYKGYKKYQTDLKTHCRKKVIEK